MARLAICLLGCFSVTLDEQPLANVVSDKARVLLAYMAIEESRPHRREALATMLWPNRPEATARTNLRQTLHRLRKSLGDIGRNHPFLLVTYQDIQLNWESDCWVDVVEFSRTIKSCPTYSHPKPPDCETLFRKLHVAADLYKGDLLPGFSLPDCPDFDWWLLTRQEEFHRQAIVILDILAYHYEMRKDYPLTCEFSQRAIELEPWREISHRKKMRALALSGQLTAATHQYEICRQILAKELGVEPSAKTKRLYQQICEGHLPQD
jgi:DNA-binding SARP family transcriptional activator